MNKLEKSKFDIYQCDHPGCNKVYSSKFSLKRHQGTHRTDKPFVCELCGKRFVLIQYLKEHSYCHTKEKIHVCGINGCQKSFRHASDMSLHRRIHPEFKLRRYCYPQKNNVTSVNETNSGMLINKNNQETTKGSELRQANSDLNSVSLHKDSAKNIFVACNYESIEDDQEYI